MTPPSAVPSVIPQVGKQQPLHALQIWIKSQAGQTLGTCLSILTNLTLSLCLAKRTVWKTPPSTFSTILLKSFSFKLLGLTICHDLSWESHISNLASKASHHLGILCCAKSFLSPPELLTTCKAFVRSLMEYCSPLRAGAPASHLSRLHAVETKAFRIIGISRDEAESLSLSLSHRRQVGGLSNFHSLFSRQVGPLFFTLLFLCFSRLWNKRPHSLQSHSFLQVFKTAVHHHLLFSSIQNLDLFYPH
uniref:Uncharacterized protein n=1 Tax=Eptatretus burgeri TaxID=7764 RepID=A0A8C4N128_EPTBU